MSQTRRPPEAEMLPGVAQQDHGRADGNQRTPRPGLSPWSSPTWAWRIPGWTPLLHRTGCLAGKRQVPPPSAPAQGLLGRSRGSLRAGIFCSSLTQLRASRGPDRMEKAGTARTRQVLGEEAREGPRYSCEGGDKGVVGDRTAKVIQGAGAPAAEAAVVTPTGSGRTRWSHSSAAARKGGSAGPG